MNTFRIFLLPLIFALSVIPILVASDGDRHTRSILSEADNPDEAIESALDYISSEYSSDKDGFKEGERIIKEILVPFTKQRAEQLSPYSRCLVYAELATYVGQQGAHRLNDVRKYCTQAIDLARQATDYQLIGFVSVRWAIFEDRYGQTEKSFELYNEAIDNYRKAPENTNYFVTVCYANMANIYLRINDLDGLKKVISGLSTFISDTDHTNRDYMAYELNRIKGVYFSNLIETLPKEKGDTFLDSLFQTTLTAINLIETSDDEILSGYTNPTWLYYNRAVQLVEYSDRPDSDSVEYYLGKMGDNPLYSPVELDFEIKLSQEQLRAEMLAKLGRYDEAKEKMTALLTEIGSQDRLNKDVIINKIDIFKSLRDIAIATGHKDDILAYSDSLDNLRRQQLDNDHRNAIKEIETKYQTKDIQLALAQTEARRANTLSWLLGASAALILVIIAFILYAERQRRKRIKKELEYSELRADIDRRLTRQYIEGLENERRRMASELHDGVCNDLLAIEMSIKSATPDKDISGRISGCRDSVRRISHELLPPEFNYANLGEVIHYYVRKQAEAHAGEISISLFSDVESSLWNRIPDWKALDLYRIVQEGLGNAIKHSGATEISVITHFENDELEIVIKDNGRFSAVKNKGIGLESIDRRARSVDATVEFHSEVNTGTVLTLLIKTTENRN